MASFMEEGLSDELASSPVKLSAVEPRPSRGLTQNHGGNNRSERAGDQGDKQPTHSPLLSFNSRQIFLLCSPPPSSYGAEQFYKPP